MALAHCFRLCVSFKSQAHNPEAGIRQRPHARTFFFGLLALFCLNRLLVAFIPTAASSSPQPS